MGDGSDVSIRIPSFALTPIYYSFQLARLPSRCLIGCFIIFVNLGSFTIALSFYYGMVASLTVHSRGSDFSQYPHNHIAIRRWERGQIPPRSFPSAGLGAAVNNAVRTKRMGIEVMEPRDLQHFNSKSPVAYIATCHT